MIEVYKIYDDIDKHVATIYIYIIIKQQSYTVVS